MEAESCAGAAGVSIQKSGDCIDVSGRPSPSTRSGTAKMAFPSHSKNSSLISLALLFAHRTGYHYRNRLGNVNTTALGYLDFRPFSPSRRSAGKGVHSRYWLALVDKYSLQETRTRVDQGSLAQ